MSGPTYEPGDLVEVEFDEEFDAGGLVIAGGWRPCRVLATGLYGWGLAVVTPSGRVVEPVNPVCVRIRFVPAKGAVRRFTCRACGYSVTERWHGAGRLDFTVETADGAPFDSGCHKHPAGHYRGFHDHAVEVLSTGAAA